MAEPYPGRGHINPMMNFCKLIALRRPSISSFVVTEEWLGLIESDPKPPNIRVATIPNVLPSEVNRAADFPGFVKATQTKIEDPVEHLLLGMKVPISVLIFDNFLTTWVLKVGNRMNIPVASFCTMSAMTFSVFNHYDLLVKNGHVGTNFLGNSEVVDYIPGVPSIHVTDLVTTFNGKGKEIMRFLLKPFFMSVKAQYLIFATVYELESQLIDALKSSISIPVYAIGPAIPYFNFSKEVQNDQNTPNYVKWLDRQPEGSVLYISQGSFLSRSSVQLDEFIAGVHDSGVKYLFIARDEASRFKCENDENGLVIPWCDQLRVLSHRSIGAFWSHCVLVRFHYVCLFVCVFE